MHLLHIHTYTEIINCIRWLTDIVNKFIIQIKLKILANAHSMYKN